MSAPDQPIRLGKDDLYSPRVEAYLEEQEVLRRPMPEIPPQPFYVRLFYSTYLYLSLAAGLGAFLAWAMLEPFFDDRDLIEGEFQVAALFFFPTVTGLVGLFLGGAEGLMCRNFRRAAICSVVGLGIGFGGGMLGHVASCCIFAPMSAVAGQFVKNPDPTRMPRGIALLLLMMGRAAAWAVAGIPAGIGQGIALRERKVILNGLLGGVLGGLLGGLLFDPIALVLENPANPNANVSRAVGFTLIGLMVGLFVGVVEQWTKSAWLLMRAGPLAGKQFIVHRNPTVLGSSPKADVYLFKDAAIEPRHALIHNRGGRYEIEDCETPDGTYVNGEAVGKHVLQSGDRIVLGKTVLEFTLKDA
jgi:hypothetical protein